VQIPPTTTAATVPNTVCGESCLLASPIGSGHVHQHVDEAERFGREAGAKAAEFIRAVIISM